MKVIIPFLAVVFTTGCSVVGKSDVENAPYTLLKSDINQNIEVRNYDSMVLVSTNMLTEGENTAFRKLFGYITGDNEGSNDIAMTAPVIMSDNDSARKGAEISMTAPVFMSENTDNSVMSFVMPKDFTLASTPKPTNPDVWVSEVQDYKVAVIQFSGTLSDSNVEENTALLLDWVSDNGYVPLSSPVKAGYNGPLTIPMFRRNEVLIEIQ